MLNSGKKIAIRETKKINILTLVMSEKKFCRKQKTQDQIVQELHCALLQLVQVV